jgi:hypothetical protein
LETLFVRLIVEFRLSVFLLTTFLFRLFLAGSFLPGGVLGGRIRSPGIDVGDINIIMISSV